MMASPRKSRRLNGDRPEIVDTKFRCICLNEGEACDLRATQLSCCRQYCHKRCLDGWYQRGHHTCSFCRQLTDVSENHDVDPIPPVHGNLSRDEVIERLDQLLSNVNLRQEIERNCLFLFFIVDEMVVVINGVANVVVNGHFCFFRCSMRLTMNGLLTRLT